MAETVLPQPDSALYRNWVMLLTGWGFNWYKLENQLRADDLLIRSRASDHLAAAAARLREFEAQFRQQYLPPPSRQHPFPDAQRLEELHRAGLIWRYPRGDLKALAEACERALAAPVEARRRIYEHFNRSETVGTVVAEAIHAAGPSGD